MQSEEESIPVTSKFALEMRQKCAKSIFKIPNYETESDTYSI